jgi:hypothetical protein
MDRAEIVGAAVRQTDGIWAALLPIRMILSKLDLLVRYWELAARHSFQGQPLAAKERTELLGLMQLVGDQELPPPMPIERPIDAHPAQLIGEGTIRAVELRAISASALFVTGFATPNIGSSMILRAVDAIAGVEYTVPCRVAWTCPDREGPAAMALVVDGEPHRLRFDDVPAAFAPSLTPL